MVVSHPKPGYNYPMLIIKRYSNRKLYDTSAKRYVTLDEIGAAVRRGEEVQVLDHDSGADLTEATLLQVMFEEEKKLGGRLPQVVLTSLMQTGSRAMTNLREAALAFNDPDQHVEDDIRRRLDLLAARGQLTPAEHERVSALLLDPSLRRTYPPIDEGASHEEVQSLLGQLEKLKQELDDLQKQRASKK
jgi:polyhydroxyalkanoate synthesis repressor PhaR